MAAVLIDVMQPPQQVLSTSDFFATLCETRLAQLHVDKQRMFNQ